MTNTKLVELAGLKKQIDSVLHTFNDSDKYFVIEYLQNWLLEEKARVRERLNYDSGVFSVEETT